MGRRKREPMDSIYPVLYIDAVHFSVKDSGTVKKRSTRDCIKKARGVYREMLEKTEDIGKNNPMAKNIYFGYVFMAICCAGSLIIKRYPFFRIPLLCDISTQHLDVPQLSNLRLMQLLKIQ